MTALVVVAVPRGRSLPTNVEADLSGSKVRSGV